MSPQDVASAVRSEGSLVAAVERLRGPGRTLERFEPGTVADEDSPLAENELVDPERAPQRVGQRIRRLMPR